MNQNEYINELKKRLRKLPQSEIEGAVGYYEEYISDSENPYEAMASLGTPAETASKIIGEFGQQKSDKRPLKTFLIILGGIFASPIAIPLALAAVVILLALVLVLFALFLSFFAAAAGIGITGLATFIAGMLVFPQSFATGLFFAGAGLFCMAAGTAAFIGTICLFRVTLRGINALIGNRLTRRGKK